MKPPLALAVLLLGACSVKTTAAIGDAPGGIQLSDAQALEIGQKIFQNEAGGKVKFLTFWGAGEQFASLGIGHFIWYPKDYRGPFEESFPPLVKFLLARGAPVPAWVAAASYCPWSSKAEFDAQLESPQMKELRDFLAATIGLQARFAADRLEQALPKMLSGLSSADQDEVRKQFYRVAQEARGVYGLMDYVNFKGEGTKDTERYNGEGWGLLQVLQGMTGDAPGQPALDEFVRSAGAVLTRRVANCQQVCDPARRVSETGWLPGWKKRLETYRRP